jgi:hypothetical protein
MQRYVLAAAVFAALTGAACAEPAYDTAIDAAAARIVAEHVGEIRGGFSYDQVPEFVAPVDWHPRRWKSGPRPA